MKVNFKPAKDVVLDPSKGVTINFQFSESKDYIYAVIQDPGNPDRTVGFELSGPTEEKIIKLTKFMRATASSCRYSTEYFRKAVMELGSQTDASN